MINIKVMKTTNFLLGCFFFAVLCAGCMRYTKSDAIGKYTAVDYKNSRDTITLFENNSYHRVIYDSFGKKLLDYTNHWSMEEPSNINFHRFIFNYDSDYNKYPELLEDTLGGGTVVIEKVNDGIGFCTGHDLWTYCYKKIE